MKKNIMKKAGNGLVVLMLTMSVFAVFVSPVTAIGDGKAGVIPSASIIEVGDSFYITTWLDPDETADTWLSYTFNWTAGVANATDTTIGAGWQTGFDDPGLIFNETGGLKGAQSFMAGGTQANYTMFVTNFTSMTPGVIDFNFTDFYVGFGGVGLPMNTTNASMTVTPQEPAAIGVTKYNHTAINLTFTPGIGGPNTTVCGKKGDFPTSPTDGVVYNGSANFYNDTGLDPCSTYYYRVWTWNETVDLHSNTYRQGYATTDCYTNFSFGGVNPTNGSTTVNCTYDIPVNVTITNSKGHAMYYWINGSEGSTESGVGASNQSVSILMNGLSHNTIYWWNVTARDATSGSDEYSESYWFTTGTGGGTPGVPSNPNPSNGVTSIPINLGTFSVDVTDPESDPLGIRFFWANGTSIGLDSPVPTPGTATINPTLNLDYGTTYQWYVIADDGCDTCRGPSSGYWSFTTDEANASITKEYLIHDNSTIQFWINITNNGEANMTNLTVLDVYDPDLNFISSTPPPDAGGDTWYIPYLNMSGYPDSGFNITLWMGLDSHLANGTSIDNLVTVMNTTIGFLNYTSTPTLEVGLVVEKTSNLTTLEWNTARVNYTINVTNTGDFPLHNVTVNETYDGNMTFESSNYGVNPNFNLGTLTPGQTKSLWIVCTTSYLDTGNILINATSHYNNVTVVSNESSEVAEDTYLFVGAQTESVRVIYDTSLTDVADIGNSVLNILGVLLIIAAIFLVIFVVQKSGLFGGE